MEGVHALAFEFAREGALEHKDHLEFDIVIVRDRNFVRAERLGHADDVRLHQSASGGRDAEVAIGRIRAQALVEILLAVVADGEFLFRPRFGCLGFHGAPRAGLAVGGLAACRFAACRLPRLDFLACLGH